MAIDSKKNVLITGCSEGGLGAELALAFAKHGFRVFAGLRTPSKAGAAFSSNSDIQVLALDVTDQASIAACKATIDAATNGRLDVLVNNAGSMFVMPLLDTSIEESKSLFDVNVWGLLAVTQAFAPLLVKTGGVILNIASIAGAVRMAWQGIYNSSKASARWLSETLRIELAPLGVRVVTAMVGEVETKIYANARAPPTLPATSYYSVAKDIIFQQGTGKLQQESEPAAVTAESLVRDVLSGVDGHVWRGGVAGRAKYASWLMPERLFEWLLHSSRGVYQIRAPK